MISPWCTRIYQNSRAPHRAGGQAGYDHSKPKTGPRFQIDGHGARQVVFQVDACVDVFVSSAVFGGREEVGVVHRDANPFRIFAILWNAGNGKFDGDRLATMVKHIGMGEKAR
ncbi:hypothetical protein TNCV_3789841 [Trichonephila clavipes]|nr:hypothetical protein TNCV_3789841 [Trichonephila clavipes]